MSLRTDLHHGRRIARAEFRRSVRGYLANLRRILGLAAAVLFGGGTLFLTVPGVYVFGRTVRTAGTVPNLGAGAVALVVGFLVVATIRTLSRISGVDAEDLLLTTVHPRAVVLGLVGAEFARLALWFGVPALAVGGTFALGLGAPTVLLTGGVVLVPVLSCVAVWGYAIGVGLLGLLRRLPGGGRAGRVVGVGALLVFAVGSQALARTATENGGTLERLSSVVSVPPLTEYVSLAFVGTPLADPVSPAAAAVGVGFVALTPVGLAAAERGVTALWFTDPPAREDGDDSTTAVSSFSPPGPFAWSEAGRIAWGILVRAVRHPQDLAHLLVLVFLAGPFGGTVLTDGGVDPVTLAGSGVVVGVYLAGAAFGLNPLGDERPQLPLVWLTKVDPATVLRGRTLAGLAVGLPVATAVPLGTAALDGDPTVALGFAVVGALMCLPAASFAPGLGCLYPIYEERDLWGTETVAPSTLVLIGYSSVVVAGAGIGLALTYLGVVGVLTPTPLLAGAVGVYLSVTVGASALSYRYARRRHRRYRLD